MDMDRVRIADVITPEYSDFLSFRRMDCTDYHG